MSELITFDVLKKFSEKCQKTFHSKPFVVSGTGNYLNIKSKKFQTFSNSKIDILIPNAGDKEWDIISSIYTFGRILHIINTGKTSIEEGKIRANYDEISIKLPENRSGALIQFTLVDMLNYTGSTTAIDLSPAFECIESITYQTDEPDWYNDGLPFKITTQEGVEPTDFSIIAKADTEVKYEKGKKFDSILYSETADQLKKAIKVKLVNGEPIEQFQYIQGGDDQEDILIPNNYYQQGDGIDISSDNVISVKLQPATKTELGGVKIGDGIDVSANGVISTETYDIATDETPGLIKVNRDDTDDKLYIQTDDESYAYVKLPDAHRFVTMPDPEDYENSDIVEYIGTTNSDYTNGYFYSRQPKIKVRIPTEDFKPINDSVDTGYLFAHYFAGKSWMEGTRAGEKIDLDKANSYDFEHEANSDYWVWGFKGDFTYNIPVEDFAKLGWKFVGNNSTGYSTVIILDNANKKHQWVQKDVQPPYYLDSEAIDFISQQEVDEIFEGPVTKIEVTNNDCGQEIPENYSTAVEEFEIGVSPEYVNYKSTGDVSINKVGSHIFVVKAKGNGSITFTSVIFGDVTKTINITKL